MASALLSRDSSGTLHYPSPSPPCLRHIDPTSTLRQLQRPFSQSPSKMPSIRLTQSKSTSSSPGSPLTPSREPTNRSSLASSSASAPALPISPSERSSSLIGEMIASTPAPVGRRARSSSIRGAVSSTKLLRSPRKRALQENASSGNSAGRSPVNLSQVDFNDQENRKILTPSADHHKAANAPTDSPFQDHSNTAVRSNYDRQAINMVGSPVQPPRATNRFHRGYNTWGAKSSPLKRGDAGLTGNNGHGTGCSPVAKRRSLHSAIFSPDFDIFEHMRVGKESDQATISHGDPLTASDHSSRPTTSMSPDRSGDVKMADDGMDDQSEIPDRTSSLRQTTLQRRHEKLPFARTVKANADLSLDMDVASNDMNTDAAQTSDQRNRGKGRQRVSLNSILQPLPRDSPFSAQGILPNASSHPMAQIAPKIQPPNLVSLAQRHPLSRTISQSTSTSSMAEDSPTHVPIRQPFQLKGQDDFSKSTSLNLTRSLPPRSHGHHEHNIGASSIYADHATSEATSFATPENYKLVKPLPAAFMSTGLISKRHKDPNEVDATFDFGASTSTMPDTPCKRHSLAEIPSPRYGPEKNDRVQARQARHSFGSPSTPFHPQSFHESPAISASRRQQAGQSAHLRNRIQDSELDHDSCTDSTDRLSHDRNTVQGQRPLHSTSSSFSIATASSCATPRIDRDLSNTFPSYTRFDSQSSNNDIPPTPTRHIGLTANGNEHGSSNASEGMDSRSTSVPRASTQQMRDISLRHKRDRFPKLSTDVNTLARQSQGQGLSQGSPQRRAVYGLSPRTPRDNIFPPDPSGLSISQDNSLRAERDTSTEGSGDNASAIGSHIRDRWNAALNSTTPGHPPPATPTAPKEYFASLNKSRHNPTPQCLTASSELDSTLVSRFSKVDLIGIGEFSQVYRVSRMQDAHSRFKNHSPSGPGSSSNSSFAETSSMIDEHLANQSGVTSGCASNTTRPNPLEQVWAVKRGRQAYHGPKDRARKMQEVHVLRSLGQSDHTLEFFDSWEHENYLYIQTEFCEEGSLDSFLDQVGRIDRLDDFRIWKIMLELSMGLKHIHDSGFIHLDLKPANVLITFEGILKIADFGMASSWPAPPGIEGEGDREYIGPEILRGEYDKPADVFALGLIMLEIAANVVLPDNGASWQRLRSGDMTDVPSLTWSSEASSIRRDSTGNPVTSEESFASFYSSSSSDSSLDDDDCTSGTMLPVRQAARNIKKAAAQLHRSGELAEPPGFMIDQTDPQALDNLVRWMIRPAAADRPAASQILATTGVRWAEARRRAGATVFEGNWGPADEVLADDAEMIDV